MIESLKESILNLILFSSYNGFIRTQSHHKLRKICVCLSLVFISLIMMYTDMDFFEFILLGMCTASQVCKFMFFFYLVGSKIGEFSAIIFQKIFFYFSFHSFPSWDSDDLILDLLILPHKFPGSVHFSNFFFPLFILDKFYWSIIRFGDSFSSQGISLFCIFQI